MYSITVQMPISDSYLRSVHGKESEKVTEKTDRDGLSVRISKKGKVVFQLRFYFAGKQKRLDIGTYPGMTLKEARDEGVRLRRYAEDGFDPALMLNERRLANSELYTVERLITEWIDVYASKNVKGYRQILRTYQIHIFPKIGKLLHDRVGTHTWLDLIEFIAKERASIARRILTTANQCHAWGHRRKLVELKPLLDVKPRDIGLKIRSTDRVLNDEEIIMLFDATETMAMTRKNVLFLRLVLLFGCRTGELAASEVSHFNFDDAVWTVPPENHKTGKRGKPLLRPIIPAAAEMIKEAMQLNGGSKFLFVRKAGYEDRNETPMTSNSFLSVPIRIRAFSLNKRGKIMPHWSMHDLRRTARTRWSVLAPPHVCEIMLGHTLPGIWSVYDHNDYLDEQRKAYSAWWAEVMRIIHGDSVTGITIRA